MTDFKIQDPSDQYTDTVNDILDLVEKLNDYEGEVSHARVVVELGTTTGKQLHFLEKQYDADGGKLNTSTGYYEQHHTDVFKDFEKTFNEFHDAKFLPTSKD